MNDALKYIIIDEIFPIIFSAALTHKDIATGMKATSAGFCFRNLDGYWQCYGESISLNLKSLGQADADKLNRIM